VYFGYFTVAKAEAARQKNHWEAYGKGIFPALGLFFVDSF
jgi:hypothetical protein